MGHPHRGKRCIGLTLDVPSGQEAPLDLVREAAVFITDILPSGRQQLRDEVNDIRTAANPVQSDEQPRDLTRAPTLAEHSDDILRPLDKSELQDHSTKLDGPCT